MNPFARQWLLPIHRWVGLTIGLVLAWMALTGAGMAFRAQLAPLIDRQLLLASECAQPPSLDGLVEIARAAYPTSPLAQIRMQPSATVSMMMRFGDNETVYLDPCSSEVLGRQHKNNGVFGKLEQWHRFKFIAPGSLVAGISALTGAIVVFIGGAFLWWSSRKANSALAKRDTSTLSPRARNIHRHRTVGIFACAVLLASALTGLPKSFNWYRDAVFAVANSEPNARAPKSPSPVTSDTRITLNEAWRIAKSAVGAVSEVRIGIPKGEKDPYTFEIVEAEAPHAEARSFVYVDASNGAILETRPYANSSAGNKLHAWMIAWHKGLLAGMVGPIVLFSGAISLLFLAYSGISSDLRRRAARRRAQQRNP